MVKASKGIRNRTRGILRWHPRLRGKVPVSHSLRQFTIGESASIYLDPRVHKGMPHRRYQGRTGVIVGARGTSYELEVMDGGKKKLIIARPEHLLRARA